MDPQILRQYMAEVIRRHEMWETGSLPSARTTITEEKPDKRPSCGYRERLQPDQPKKECGSEERLFSVSGTGTWGKAKTTPVCSRHLTKAWKEWSVDSATPISDLPTGKP